jgi:hypothetical protein
VADIPMNKLLGKYFFIQNVECTIKKDECCLMNMQMFKFVSSILKTQAIKRVEI